MGQSTANGQIIVEALLTVVLGLMLAMAGFYVLDEGHQQLGGSSKNVYGGNYERAQTRRPSRFKKRSRPPANPRSATSKND